MCNPMFIAALFTIAKIQKQPKCPPTDEWTKKIWYIYNGILLSHKKKEQTFAMCNNMDLQGIMLSEVSQRKINTVYHLCMESKKHNRLVNITKKKQTHR